MKIVIDTNIMFSILIVKNSKHEAILFGSVDSFYTPNFAFVELYEKKEKILKYTKRSPEEFRKIFERIINIVEFVRGVEISQEDKTQAYQLCQGIDEKDTPFVALAMHLHAPLWTGDKTLKKGLRAKGFQNFFEQQD